MGLELIVLGSGTPFAHPRRASSSCLVRAGERQLLVDAGGGTLLRLGENGIDPGKLDAVLLTHTHADHSGGLPAVVFAAVMSGGGRTLRLLGPAGRDIHPGVGRFAELLFGERGAWSYLRTFDGFDVEARELPSDPAEPAVTGVEDGIRSMPIAHGTMPSVAYRIEADGRSLAISGDPEAYQPQLVELARGCDVLVHDFALPERETEHGHLHAAPSEVGRVAAEAEVRRLVLTHVFPEHEAELDASLALVRREYDGEIVVAYDGLRVQ